MRTVVLTVLVCACLATPSHAADAADLTARALYEQAQKAYDSGDIRRALALYQQAHEAKPLAGFVFNIAQCHRQLRNYEQAAFYFKRYLERAPNTPNAKVVADLISEVEQKHAEAVERERAEAARVQEVELARLATARAETAAAAQRQEQAHALELATARALTEKPPAAAAAPPRLLRSGWFWASVGVLATGIAAGAIYAGTAPSPRSTTLGTDSAR